jgi:outer membrane cobalamin receptor
MKLSSCFLLILFFKSFPCFPQHIISGYIQDAENGEKLIGANIFSKNDLSGTVSNAYGFFSISLPEGDHTLYFSYVGYETKELSIALKEDLQQVIELKPSINLEEVTVSANSFSRSIGSTQMSSINIPVENIKKIPALLGEVDVIKAIQLLPGVQSGTEGASGLYVRGGGPDQNLILLDGTPVYNASHLFGFFSVFNADAINNIELIKGGFPARYGGRLSSVLDISLKEGNMKKFSGSGSIGLISSRLTLEGPIIKDKTSFIVSARRTYLDYLIQPFLRSLGDHDQYTSQGYFFYDLNAKINHKFSYKDRLYFSVYSGSDKFYLKQDPYTYLFDGDLFTEESNSGLGWGNVTSALRWNHQFSNKLFSNTTLTYSQYNFKVNEFMQEIAETDSGTFSEVNSLEFLSGIEDFAAKIDFDYIPDPDHYIRFGISNTYHTFKPGASTIKLVDMELEDIDTITGQENIHANEIAAYIEDDYKISNNLKTNLGIHYSGFLANGKYYHSLQPRAALRYLFSQSLSAKASYSYMQQYIHLLTNNNIGLPTDLWVPATDKILPQKSHQVALGISKHFQEKYKISIEGYYKSMNNLIEYKDGSSFMGQDENWEEKVETGKGWSYGGEVFLEKRFGKLTGWIGYTMSWTERQFPNINEGKVFPYKYDRRHDVSVVASFPLSEKWDVSASWIYGTGTAHTLPTERYYGSSYQNYGIFHGSSFLTFAGSGEFSGEIEHIDSRNSIRAADYHRLDISFSRTKKRKWGEGTWTLGVYNVYNRKNPFYYYIGHDMRGNRALRRVSLFPFIPSATWSFSF